MADYPGWYPPGQVCYPPELPTYLKSVHDLKPITGVPSDEEVIEIHAVIQVANRASTIPGMSDPELLMELGDHLFSAQMAVYRSKYTSLLFPSDVTYTPPTLPAHVLVNLELISGAPSDEQVTKVQEAIRSYQKYSEIPSMFEPRVSAELSQHLFDIQMARYMSRAARHQPATRLQAATHDTTNNAGTGADLTESRRLPEVGVRDILERSNQLAERANQLSERSNQLIERSNQIAEQTSQLVERAYPERPTEQPTNPSEQFNELTGRLNQHPEQPNRLVEEYRKPIEQLGDVLKTINKVLVGIQHAIVRNHRSNTREAIKCLVNEKGDVPPAFYLPERSGPQDIIGFRVGNQYHQANLPDEMLAHILRSCAIGEDLFGTLDNPKFSQGNRAKAVSLLSQYWSSALSS
ncbi:hypothetical protein RSOLAG22IIIB_07491 [Rhizoctonia solani]|uniref:Laminin domain protein n=1 Tax=Rhizoctonia solani TaxID=456999 RepID=A0A0K6FN92_9AGAM|nr:hypothetical protein RSOLAG22IIIB_07491 [Rhizoctonia solani]